MYEVLPGRGREKVHLIETLNSQRAELVAVYGRRRIGKTYLVRAFYKENIMFSISGLRNGLYEEQIENFMLELNNRTDKFKGEKPSNWLQVFDVFKRYLKTIRKSKKKKVIFIDEFPWIDTQRSGFLSAFENFWNSYCTTRSDLIVVVCGSAASYMIKKIVRNRGGLHNRITKKIKLNAFTLSEVKEFFTVKKIAMPDIEIIRLYMALGGVAEYLEYVQPGDSAVTAIERICFKKGAQLEHEFNEVFKSLYDEGSYHEQIITGLAKGAKKGVTREELLTKNGLKSGGQFSKSLNELIESGFIEKYQAYRNNKKATLYRIIDEFSLFYLQFMAPIKGTSWMQLHTKKQYSIWCGYTFETICYKHIESIKKALGINQIESTNYIWSNNQAQIDLVIDRVDNMVNLCEIKFYNDTFNITADYAAKLRNKETEFKTNTKTRKGINTVMVSTFGTSGVHAVGLVTQSIGVEGLFFE